MEIIARRGNLEAWAQDPFDPEKDEVELRIDGKVVGNVLWQSALKHGYWVAAHD